ncbi:RNA polymerase sigma factor [Azorhizobium oxalatiphilum]|uniref:RNA polymerase sigma factor n=1 Tax=Azorhizobium oxalatiphilum TaxID=980631 RepID=A0A917C9Z4_9HYPH|nr:sigma-70 family RNA polymerase sigma factor [Azorhizobium oxalatiphilum]GGF79761.1 RNA polymerase sigma factor [Azorhizobium oxalatiphilum]
MTKPLPGRRDDGLAQALAGCAAGDAACLRRLYDGLAPQMTGVAIRLLRRRELAEDVVHDTFVRIWEKAALFDPERGEARTWMFAILRNRALDVLRGEGRTDLVDDFEPMGMTDESVDAEAAVTALSEAGALRRCLGRLQPVQRSVVVLAYTRGLSHGELAGRLGVPLGTVKSWMRRSLLALRECMA